MDGSTLDAEIAVATLRQNGTSRGYLVIVRQR
jgi:hypothetical protein